MLFTIKHKVCPTLTLNINGSPISFVEKFKYLGVVFGRTLSYKHHANYLVTKCAKRINLMRILSGIF